MVTLTPLFSFSLLVETRKASSSVMSASSWLVTAGIMMALRNRLAPLIFLMRPNSLRSIGPNLAKSTLGQGISPSAAPSPPAGALAAWALVCAAPAITDLVNACTSSWVMRPLLPEPLTSSSGTPSSRANLRTEGEACGTLTGAAVGLCAGTARAAAGVGAVVAAATGATWAAGALAATATAAEAAAGAAADAAAVPSSTANRSPMLIVSPSLTLSSLITPAADEGISIEALSDSTVMSDCSSFTVSPGFTNTSITATSLKSPMSGTRTSTRPAAAGEATTAGAAGAAGTAGDAGATAGAADTAAAGADAPSASSSNTTVPSLILSPILTLSSLTTPACEQGISIDALSDSTVIRLCSGLTESPGFTSNSITATSLKSPMSGTLTSINAMLVSLVQKAIQPRARAVSRQGEPARTADASLSAYA